MEFARQLHTHHLRNQHGDGLTEHGSLGFDSTYAPTQYA